MCRTYANLVRQAKSKQKILDKMYEAGLTKPVQHRATFHIPVPRLRQAASPRAAVHRRQLCLFWQGRRHALQGELPGVYIEDELVLLQDHPLLLGPSVYPRSPHIVCYC